MTLKIGTTFPNEIKYVSKGNTTSLTILKYGETTVWGKPYTLTTNIGANTSVTITRIESPNQHASTGALQNGSTIYHGDILKITASANSGYNLSTFTVNGSNFTNGNTITIAGNVSIVTTAILNTSWKTVWSGNTTLTPVLTIKEWNVSSFPTAIYHDNPILSTSNNEIQSHLSSSSSNNTRISGTATWSYESSSYGSGTINTTFTNVLLNDTLSCTGGPIDFLNSTAYVKLNGFGSQVSKELSGITTTYYGLLCTLTDGEASTSMMGSTITSKLTLHSINITKIERYY